MRLDQVALQADDRLLTEFVSYKLESNLFVAGDVFAFELDGEKLDIPPGSAAILTVNGQQELVGVIERVSDSYDKSGIKYSVEGRDLMGLLINNYITTFKTLENMSLKDLAVELFQEIPFISRHQKEVIFGRGNKDLAATQKKKPMGDPWNPHPQMQLTPGMTYYEALKTYALQEGKLFFCLADGTFVFGIPVTAGAAEFQLETGINIISVTRVRDISQRYSQVKVIGQQPGLPWLKKEDLNVSGEAIDPGFPMKKTLISVDTSGGSDLADLAWLTMTRQRFAGYTLTYRTDGHSQFGKNYQVNSICHVKDTVLKIDQDFLIYGRVFEMTKEGVFTTLKLSELGVFPS